MKFLSLIEEGLANIVNELKGPVGLKQAMSYALLSPGKRIRPLIVLEVAEALGAAEAALPAALAVEIFHTASLIADDLPCMDDEKVRRGQPTLHAHYGESAAVLTTYALIALGYELIAKSASLLGADGLSEAIVAISKNTGLCGATGGQFLDLFDNHPDLEELQRLKTGTLFELSFVLGWLFGGGKKSKIPWVEKAAHHFGMAYQIQDDLEDMATDSVEKNYALKFGIEPARERLFKEINDFILTLEKLEIRLEQLPLLHQLQLALQS
jgi:geranylgeranyl diphosphate synthase type II